MTTQDYAMIDEVLSRTRRIETRLTSYLVSIGAHTAAERNIPVWVEAGTEGFVSISGVDVSLSACLRAIPEGYCGEVNVIHDGTIVAVLNV